jgi:hypothetical protein
MVKNCDPEGAGSAGVCEAICLEVLVLECDPLGRKSTLDQLAPAYGSLACDQFSQGEMGGNQQC